MPAYNYFPATYSPFGQAYYQQAYQQQAQQIQPNGIIWVSGDSEADAYPIAPNNAVTLWHRTMPIVYFKQADASGRPSMRVYNLVERTQNAPESHSQTQDKQIPAYATKEEVEAVSEEINGIKAEIKSMKKSLTGRKGDDNDE